ncbi:uncharacterized protein [Physcomitrium patens]|uniref:Cytochrome c oxidase copper chaperone n=1 Tax=Physcomitrium patens TaxID=3218 RepID=A0A2K1K1T8_PHYPA|nr:hypothetical protein PHYPA_012217 [Physcomitrium patens]
MGNSSSQEVGKSSTTAVTDDTVKRAVTPVAAAVGPAEAPKKKICCACPETKKLRDDCIVEHGENACAKWIEAHKQCLRREGFNV